MIADESIFSICRFWFCSFCESVPYELALFVGLARTSPRGVVGGATYVQELIPPLAVQTFQSAVLHRFARLNEKEIVLPRAMLETAWPPSQSQRHLYGCLCAERVTSLNREATRSRL